jgi:hypothetical protein
MNTAQFVALTASDAWLTPHEISALLDEGGYWSGPYQHLPSGERLAHIVSQVRSLKNAAGKPLFEQITSLGPDGQTVVRYKQARLIRPNRGTCSGDE